VLADEGAEVSGVMDVDRPDRAWAACHRRAIGSGALRYAAVNVGRSGQGRPGETCWSRTIPKLTVRVRSRHRPNLIVW
jgi:hypothetical protein